MRVLFIGGTGNISTAVSRMCVERGIELTLLNRGRRAVGIPGASSLVADIHEPEAAARALDGHSFDVVVNWIAFTPADVERDIDLFAGRTKQYVFISSASCYQRPLLHPVITESTPLRNPYWEYSRNKIACEDRLTRAYRDDDFPITIVRPSLTYDTVFPVAIGGWADYTLVDRMQRGAPVIVHGDGTGLWTVTHAEDFARGFVGLLGHTQAIGHAFHITSDEVLTWDQIYLTIAEAAGAQARLIHIPSEFIASVEPSLTGGLLGDKATSAILDNAKIKRFVPGYQAVIPFREGIRRTLAWFDADPARKRVVPAVDEMMDRIVAAWENKRAGMR